jgi:hypothetical protein
LAAPASFDPSSNQFPAGLSTTLCLPGFIFNEASCSPHHGNTLRTLNEVKAIKIYLPLLLNETKKELFPSLVFSRKTNRRQAKSVLPLKI